MNRTADRSNRHKLRYQSWWPQQAGGGKQPEVYEIQEQQQVVLESFVKNIRLALLPRVRRGGMGTGSHVSTSWDALLAATAGSSLGDEVPPAVDDPKLQEYRERLKAKRTLARADHLLQAVQDRKLELRVLWDNAKTTSGAVR